MSTSERSDDLELLNQLSAAEDEFDIDLMACGCRLAASSGMKELSVIDLIRLYNFDEQALAGFIGALIDAGKVSPDKIHDLAEKAVRGKLKEPPSTISTKPK